MGYWRWEDYVLNAITFCITGLLTGYIVEAFGTAFESLPGVPFNLAYLAFFIVIPAIGYVSDFEEMVVRGLVFTLTVFLFSFYIGDPWESVVAMAAFMVGLYFSYRKW